MTRLATPDRVVVLVVYLFWCSCIVCSLLLVCAVLKMLHSVKSILNEEECKRVGQARHFWDDELAVILATKPCGRVQETLGMLEKYKRQGWYHRTFKGIKSKLSSRTHHLSTVWRVPFNSRLPYLHLFLLPSAVTVYTHTHTVDLWY